MRTTPSTHRKLGFRNLCAAALLLGVAFGAGAADDTALFSTSFPPNVLLMVDNSNSMNEIMRHPASVESAAAGLAVRGCNILPHTGGGAARSTTSRPGKSTPYRCYPGVGCWFRSTTPPRASPRRPSHDGRSRQRLHHAEVLRPDAQALARRPADEHERLNTNDNPTWIDDDYLEWYFSIRHQPHHDDLRAPTTRRRPRSSRTSTTPRTGGTTSAAPPSGSTSARASRRARDRSRRDLQDEHERRAVRPDCRPGCSQDVVRFGLATVHERDERRLRVGAGRRLQHELRPRSRPASTCSTRRRARRSPRRSSSSTRTSCRASIDAHGSAARRRHGSDDTLPRVRLQHDGRRLHDDARRCGFRRPGAAVLPEELHHHDHGRSAVRTTTSRSTETRRRASRSSGRSWSATTPRTPWGPSTSGRTRRPRRAIRRSRRATATATSTTSPRRCRTSTCAPT